MNRTALDPSCWLEDCDQDRLPYSHACLAHDGNAKPLPPTRCQRPLRCYCDATPACLGHVDNLPTWRKPGPMPAEVRDQLAELRARRAERKSA